MSRRDLPEGPTGRPALLADLGFPCHLECTPCRRYRPPSPRELVAVERALRAAVAEHGGGVLRVVFFGGDVFARATDFEALLRDVGQACREGDVVLDAAAFSDGTAWDGDAVARLHALGVHHYQVVLDGPRAFHDLLRPLRGGGGSFDLIMRSMAHRGLARVVLRADPAIGAQPLSDLVRTLEEHALFAPPNPVAVLVSPLTDYAREARELLQVIDLLAGDGGDPRRELSAAAGSST